MKYGKKFYWLRHLFRLKARDPLKPPPMVKAKQLLVEVKCFFTIFFAASPKKLPDLYHENVKDVLPPWNERLARLLRLEAHKVRDSIKQGGTWLSELPTILKFIFNTRYLTTEFTLLFIFVFSLFGTLFIYYLEQKSLSKLHATQFNQESVPDEPAKSARKPKQDQNSTVDIKPPDTITAKKDETGEDMFIVELEQEQRTKVSTVAPALAATDADADASSVEISLPSQQRAEEPPRPSFVPDQKPVLQKYAYYQSPFFYRLKTRATDLVVAEPFSEDRKAEGKHNSHGFRTPEYTIARPPNTFRIVVIGDSATWGRGVQAQEAFPALLQNILKNKCSPVSIEVISLGLIGHRLVDNWIKLLAHGQSLKPDLVLFQIRPKQIEFYDYFSISRFQGRTVPFAQRVMNRDSLDRKVVREVLAEIQNWSRKKHVQTAFVAFPLLDVSPDGRNFNQYVFPRNASPYLVSFQDVMAEVRQKHKTLDLTETFKKRAGTRYLAVSLENGNPNRFAHQIAAETLADFLFREKLMNCSKSNRHSDPLWVEEKTLRIKAASQWDLLHGDYDKQVEFYIRLADLYPRDGWTVNQLAYARLKSKRKNQAYSNYERLLQLAPDVAAPWYLMSKCIVNSANQTELLQRMITIVPDHTLTMKDLAAYYLEQEQKEKACKLLVRLTEIPKSSAHFEFGQTLLAQNCMKPLAADKQ